MDMLDSINLLVAAVSVNCEQRTWFIFGIWQIIFTVIPGFQVYSNTWPGFELFVMFSI